MIVQVDALSPVPIFEQLRSQIARMIVSGQLRPGSKLPTVRQLATDLGLARGTVNKVYEVLAREGLVISSGRHGTIVLEGAHLATTQHDVLAAADTLALVARQLGLDKRDAHDALDEAWARHSPS